MSDATASALGTNWDDFEQSNFTSKEIAESDLRVSRMIENIKRKIDDKGKMDNEN